MAILTTTVGWFPKPAALRRARWRFAEGEIDAAELRQVESEATRQVIDMQRSVGIDLAVDGQMDRGDMVGSFADTLGGVEVGGLVRCFGNRYYRKPRIVGEIERTRPMTVEHWKSSQQNSEQPLKAIVTGPYTLMDWSFDEFYGSREACCMALAEAVRAEVEELVTAGATDVEIDEPAITVRPDELPLATRALAQVTASVRGKARTWCHLAYGDPAASIDELVSLPVDGLLVEMANSEFSLVDRIPTLPEGMAFGAGVIDVIDDRVETRDELVRTIERIRERIPADRLWIMPDSGLRTLSTDVARAKLEVLVAAAAACG